MAFCQPEPAGSALKGCPDVIWLLTQVLLAGKAKSRQVEKDKGLIRCFWLNNAGTAGRQSSEAGTGGSGQLQGEERLRGDAESWKKSKSRY